MTMKRWMCPKCCKEMMTGDGVRARFHGDCGVWMKCVERTKEREAKVKAERKPSARVRNPGRVVYMADEDDFPEFGYWGEGGTS
jgi:hypothetical protein